MSRRDDLITLLGSVELGVDGMIDDSTPLFGSGLLDSLALVALAEWVQREIDEPVDLARFNILEEWQTVGRVLEFVDRHDRHSQNLE